MALTDKLSAIGSAIREKTGGTELLTLDAMPVAIQGIQAGGGELKMITIAEQTFTRDEADSEVAITNENFPSAGTPFYVLCLGSNYKLSGNYWGSYEGASSCLTYVNNDGSTCEIIQRGGSYPITIKQVNNTYYDATTKTFYLIYFSSSYKYIQNTKYLNCSVFWVE